MLLPNTVGCLGGSFQCSCSCQPEAAQGELRMLVVQDLPEACHNHATNPQFLTGTYKAATSLNTNRQTAGRDQGFPGDCLRLLDKGGGTNGALYFQSFGFLQDRNGVEKPREKPTATASKRPRLINGHSLKERGNGRCSKHRHLLVPILIQCTEILYY